MSLEARVRMKHSIKAWSLWLENHPHVQQWGWFVLLWCVGLMSVMLIAYPIKFLVKLAS